MGSYCFCAISFQFIGTFPIYKYEGTNVTTSVLISMYAFISCPAVSRGEAVGPVSGSEHRVSGSAILAGNGNPRIYV